MKYLLNILFATIISISILPLPNLSSTGGAGYHSHNEYTQCHCNIHKISKDAKVSYIIDCNNNDKHIISNTAQLRTTVLTGNTAHNAHCTKFSYLSLSTKTPERALTTDTPPPKAV